MVVVVILIRAFLAIAVLARPLMDNGETFESKCELDLANCRRKTNILLAPPGVCCGECHHLLPVEPICGDDGETYRVTRLLAD